MLLREICSLTPLSCSRNACCDQSSKGTQAEVEARELKAFPGDCLSPSWSLVLGPRNPYLSTDEAVHTRRIDRRQSQSVWSRGESKVTRAAPGEPSFRSSAIIEFRSLGVLECNRTWTLPRKACSQRLRTGVRFSIPAYTYIVHTVAPRSKQRECNACAHHHFTTFDKFSGLIRLKGLVPIRNYR
jgi:hypothetical protein